MTNQTPTAQAHSKIAAPGTIIPLSDLFTFSDPDGLSDIISFDVKDKTPGGGYLIHNGVAYPEGQLTPDQDIGTLSEWSFVVGASGSDTIGFNATDHQRLYSPTVNAIVTASVNHKPVAEAHNVTAAPGTIIALSDLFTFSDADGLSDIISFDVRDKTIGGGYLIHNGVPYEEGQLTPDQDIGTLSDWSFVVGASGSDTIGFNVTDSHKVFSTTVSAKVTSNFVNHLPVVQPHDFNATPRQSIALSSLFSASDPDSASGDTVTEFAVRDRTLGGGYLTRDGVRQQEKHLFDHIPISDLGLWAFVAGGNGASNTIGFNAYDKSGHHSASVGAKVTVGTVTTKHVIVPAGHLGGYSFDAHPKWIDVNPNAPKSLAQTVLTHPGVDIDAKAGSAIDAFSSGIIQEIGSDRTSPFGCYIIIRHPSDATHPENAAIADGKTFYTLYLHMNKPPNDGHGHQFHVGDAVSTGEQIGQVGNSGTGDGGYHVHFEMRLFSTLTDVQIPDWWRPAYSGHVRSANIYVFADVSSADLLNPPDGKLGWLNPEDFIIS